MDYDWHDDRRTRRMAPYRFRKTRHLMRRLYDFTFTPAFLALTLITIAVIYFNL